MKTHHKMAFLAGLIIISGLLPVYVAGQNKNWEWIKPIYSKSANAGYSIVADDAGNTFVAGSFSDTLYVAGKQLISKGVTDIFIAAFSPKGEVKWLKQAGGTDADEAYGIRLDNQGNVYATGYFSGIVDFSGYIIRSPGNRNFFVAKYKGNGDFVWIRSGQVENEDFTNFICTDNSGNVFVSGVFHGTIYMGTKAYKSRDHKDLFFAKFNTDGDLQWMKTGGGDEKDRISAIHTDDDGSLYITGSFEKVLVFDKMLVESSGKRDIFLAKFTPEGHVDWLRKGGSATGDDYSTAIEVDQTENIYITGYFSGLAYFDGKQLKSAGSDDIFLVKYDSMGNVIWSRQAGGQGNEHARSLIMDTFGDVYLAGEFDHSFSFAKKNVVRSGDWDVFVLRYSQDGEMMGSSQVDGTGFKRANSLAIDKTGNVYLLGYFIQQASFGNILYTSPGPQGGGFIAKIPHFPAN